MNVSYGRYHDAVGKPWLFPAWISAEREWALSHNASRIMISMQYYALMAALRQAKERYDVLAIAAAAAVR